MDIQIKAKFVNYLFKMLSGQYDSLPVVYAADNPEFVKAEEEYRLPEAIPEEVGVTTKSIMELYKRLLSNKGTGLQAIMILRRCQIISEGYLAPYSRDYRHISYSMCKSVTAMAVGIAIKEEYIKLDDKISDLFPERIGILTSKHIKEITIRHLLTMETGVKFNELSTVFEADWVKGYFESDCSFAPGSNFEYNSLNTYILSVIICKTTGMSLLDYVKKHIFIPLGITDATWETCPAGYEKGGWGLKLSLMDMAKLGQLYLQKGRWLIKGTMREIVPDYWVELSTNLQTPQNVDTMATGYGFQIWILPNGSYMYNGFMGQNVVVIPRRDMVIVTQSGGINMFPDGKCMRYIEEFINEDSNFTEDILQSNPVEQYIYKHSLANMEVLEKFKISKPDFSNLSGIVLKKLYVNDTLLKKYIRKSKSLNDRTFYFDENVGSVLPIVLQAVYNNYSKGVTKLRFTYDEYLAIEFVEENNVNNIKIGFTEPIYQDLTMNGNTYKIGSIGRFKNDEDGNVVLVVKTAFVEQANVRIIKIFFLDDRIKLQLLEAPDLDDMLDNILEEDIPLLKGNIPFLNSSDYMRYRLDKFISPWGYGFENKK